MVKNSIHTKWIKIRILADNNKLIVRIADNGVGINSEVKSQIFDPFFTTKSVGKGTGLGLAISYQIVVDQHRGLLWCESNPGQGTEFFIQIPMTDVRNSDNLRNLGEGI